ncbi:MAG TPA: GGDEF domain-containing protein [Candidatus Bathyarchaeia archaeon]|nr:GGDEF domain-containing protein [Candidatus Bathyarchaeia archaeon]
MTNIYRELFHKAPVSIIELDYSPMARLKTEIKSKNPADIRSFLLSHPKKLKEAFGRVKVRTINDGALCFYGVASKKAFMDRLSKSFTGRALDVLVEQMVVLFSGGTDFSGEMKCRTAKKQSQDVFLCLKLSKNNREDLSSVIMTLQDITAWKRLERQLRKEAQIDMLTRLLNQGAMVDRLNHELIRAKRYGLELSCMMIDIDFFKVINDKFGHQKGDRILFQVAKMIRDCFRKVDVIGRYGGDEFVVVLPETSSKNAYYAAHRLQRIFAETLFKYKKVISFHITLSIGIAGYSAKTKKIKDAKDLIALADGEMYNCKMNGRNRISVAKN